jgi:inosine/xanthosine triphosphate pyrophosphatase family protein
MLKWLSSISWSKLTMKLVIATFNEGKRREYRNLLASLRIELLTLQEAGVNDEIEETGATLLA